MAWMIREFSKLLLIAAVCTTISTSAEAQGRRGRRGGGASAPAAAPTPAPAAAPEPAPAPAAAAPAGAGGAAPAGGGGKATTYDFEDDLVTGDLVRPDGEMLVIRRRGSRASLIRIREHFVPEMLKSVENL